MDIHAESTTEIDGSAPVTGLLPHRACQNCVKVKVKCIPQEEADYAICQRCFRLKKTCLTSAPASRKRRKLKGSKVAQLENRINELSTFLDPTSNVAPSGVHTPAPNLSPWSSSHDQDNDSHQKHATITASAVRTPVDHPHTFHYAGGRSDVYHEPVSPSTTDGEPSTLLPSEGGPEYPASSIKTRTGTGSDAYISAPLVPSLGTSRQVIPLKPAEFCPVFLDSNLEATLFGDFRTKLSPLFPFVVLNGSVSVDAMKRDRPFLFWACIAATSLHHRQLHNTLTEEMLKGIGVHTFAKGVKNLDLLQAILVMLAWYHFYAHLSPQLINLLHLANALVVDLGLNRPSFSHDRVKLATESAELLHGRRVVSGLKTSDERRAYLGCYFLTSKISMCCTRLDPMRYSKHMHESCQFLQAADEVKSDAYLVQLVNLHRLTRKYIPDDLAAPGVPMRMYSTMFSNELDRFRQELPSRLQSSAAFKGEIGCCKVSLYEPSQFKDCEGSMERLESLHLCLGGLKECYSSLAEISPVEFSSAPFTTWVSLMHCFIVLARLCFLKIDGWDLKYVRSSLNFPSLAQGIIEKFEAISEHNKTEKPESAGWHFSLYAEKMRRSKNWYEAKISAEEKALTVTDNGSEIYPGSHDAFDANVYDFAGTFDDEALWGDMMGDLIQF